MNKAQNLTLKEKKKLIDKSLDLDDLSIKALPDSTIDDYFFVSYSHKDYKEVYKDLLDLEENGLKIWYDRALAAGKNWEENAFKFMKPIACRGVIFYTSKNSLSSEATLQEITYAKEFGKTIIPVNLPIETHETKQILNLSARGMIEELEKSGYVFSDEDKKKYLSVFPDNMIFLPISMAADKKVEKIKANLTLPEKIVIEQDLSDGDNNVISITKVLDQNILEITEADFDKAYSSVTDFNFTIHGEQIADTVFAVDSAVFANCYYLKTIHIKETIPAIKFSTYSFYNCENLSSVQGAFRRCIVYLKSFANCKKLKRIGAEDCWVMLFGKSAFLNCESLEKIIVNLDTGHNSIPLKTFFGCKSLKEVVLDYDDDERIGENMAVETSAFEGCESLKSLKLPKYLKKIGHFAFKDCKSLTSMRIPKLVSWSGYGVFAGCVNLEKISVDKKNPTFDSREDCNAMVLSAKNILVAGCKKTVIPESVVEIGRSAFMGCEKLKNIAIPASVKTIAENAFKDCIGLKEISLSEGLERIGDYAFSGCVEMESIRLPNTVKEIGLSAFSKCVKLKEIVIPEGVETLAPVFEQCTNLEKVVLPKSLKLFSPDAFYRCEKLKTIVYNGTVRQWKKMMEYWEDMPHINAEEMRAEIGEKLAGTEYFDRLKDLTTEKINPPTNVVICSDGEAQITWMFQ